MDARARRSDVACRHLTPRRPPLRLRAALPRRLGAQPLGASRGRSFRARTRSSLSRRSSEAKKPLGRGVFVFDAGDNNNYVKKTHVELRLPFPRSEFEGRAYGPYLIIRTRKPTVTIAHYLDAARKAELIGKSLAMGDADINYATIRQAQVRLFVRSRSRVSS